jgi:hypothetical protein
MAEVERPKEIKLSRKTWFFRQNFRRLPITTFVIRLQGMNSSDGFTALAKLVKLSESMHFEA